MSAAEKPWLETLTTPVLRVAPPSPGGEGRDEGGPQADIAARFDALEKRVLTLEALVHKTSGLANAVKDIIARWPGPFTAQQIREAVRERFPELMKMMQHQSLESKIHRMEKQGIILCTFRGAGPHPSIYVRVAHPDSAAGRCGTKRNSRHNYESGFRAIVRSALDELPAQFTLENLQRWVAEKHPELVIPQGSWSSTLYKLCELEELRVVRFGHRGKTLKVYARTEKRVAANGDDLRELETAWREFRSTINAEVPEMLPGLKREEA